jgi:Arm DNA-binding domain
MAIDTNDEVRGTNNEIVETGARADLLWDDEVRGLCLRVYVDDSKSFVFVYRIADRQRFLRIGTSPPWSLKAARARAKQLRSIVDQGRDPACENRGREIPPVEDLIQYIAENVVTKA